VGGRDKPNHHGAFGHLSHRSATEHFLEGRAVVQRKSIASGQRFRKVLGKLPELGDRSRCVLMKDPFGKSAESG
jgi:hypothetical protein